MLANHPAIGLRPSWNVSIVPDQEDSQSARASVRDGVDSAQLAVIFLGVSFSATCSPLYRHLSAIAKPDLPNYDEVWIRRVSVNDIAIETTIFAGTQLQSQPIIENNMN